MTYDFDTPINRRGTNACKWDVPESELPMWIADMDFETAPAVKDAILRRAAHGCYGYTEINSDWHSAYANWWRKRHGLDCKEDWFVFTTGVIPAISSTVRKLTTPNENVVIQTPVYNIFFNSIINNGARVLESPLIYKNGAYSIDFVDLEAKLAEPQTTLMLLCNPHNPVGKIWPRETLAKIGELAKKHHVTVISDEIHCDLCDSGREYVPFLSVSEVCREVGIACVAPTKTFNIAGIQTAAVMIANPNLRYKVTRALNTDEVAEPNVFALEAPIAAFNEGGAWLDALRDYITENKRLAEEFVAREIPQLHAVKSEATYLLWLDCREVSRDSEYFQQFLRESVGLYLSAGDVYGKSGDGFMRMNLACPRSLVEDGLGRLRRGVELKLMQNIDDSAAAILNEYREAFEELAK